MKAIILAGGSGTRLWPLSRSKYPKQFLKIHSGKSLLQLTTERLLKILPPEDIITVTYADYKFHVIDDLDIFPHELLKNIVVEPSQANTAAAIALAVKYCMDRLHCDKSDVLIVTPADLLLQPEEKFIERVMRAQDIARAGNIIAFGIKPTHPKTGFGYLKKGPAQGDFFRITEFIEKPEMDAAEKYCRDQGYLWNAGIFAFTISTIIEEFKIHMPQIYQLLVASSFEDAWSNFANMPDISFDNAIMEKSKCLAVLPLDMYWNDIGSWDSLFEVFEKDSDRNVKVGDVVNIESKETFIIGDRRLIATIGLDNVMILDTGDSVLIAKRGDSQKVKEMVDILKTEGRIEAEEHRTIYRPWGQYTVLEEGQRYKIKRIVVKSLARLSLQLHHHRSEHWVVVRGAAKVTIASKEAIIHENESAYVPKSTPHRLENPGKIPLEIIEIQNGEYVGEDDIVRFDDIYGRVSAELSI